MSGRKIKVPKENRRVSTAAQRVSAQKFLTVSDSINNWLDSLVINSPSEEFVSAGDSFTLDDTFNSLVGANQQLADSILIGDQFLLGFGLDVSDSNSLADSVQTVQGLTIQLSDSVLNLNDGLEASEVGNLTQEHSETLSQSDSLRIGYGFLIVDSSELSDAFLANADQFLPLADFFFPPMEEDILVVPHGTGFTLERSDFIELFDEINLFSAGFKSLSDSFTLSDAYSASSAGFQSFSDSLSQSDAISIVIHQRLMLSDSAGNLADGVAGIGQIWDIGIIESTTLSDAVNVSNASVNLSVVASDSMNNLADTVIAKMPRWKDAISVVRETPFNNITQAVTDTLTSMGDSIMSLRAQFARPVSDISVGLWSTTPLFNKIDETTVDDSDLIVSATNPANDTCEVGLITSLTDPSSSSDHILRYRYKKSANAGRQIALTVTLMQGTTTIATFSHANIDATITQADQTLSGAQADAITNYGDLRIRFTANVSGSGAGRAAHVTWALFECPK